MCLSRITILGLIAFAFCSPSVLSGMQDEGAAPSRSEQEEPPKPKAKLTDADIKKFQPLLSNVLKQAAAHDQIKRRGALKKLADAIQKYEEENGVGSVLGDDEAWRRMFETHYRSAFKKRIGGSGSIKRETFIRVLNGEPTGFEFHYSLPRSYDPKKPWPVLLALHDRHRKSTGKQYIKGIWDDTKESKKIRENFIIVAPTLGDKTLKGKIGKTRLTTSRVEWFDRNHALAMILPLRFVRTNFNCDPSRVYVEGVGEGAQMAIDLGALFGAQLFAGVVARQGQPRSLDLIAGLWNRPVLFAYREGGPLDQGDALTAWDDLKMFAKKKEITTFEFLKAPALSAKVARMPKTMGGQGIDPLKDQNGKIWSWLAEKRLEAYPKHIRFITNNPIFSFCSFVKLTSMDLTANRKAEIALDVDREKNVIKATTTNVYRFSIFLNDSILDLDKPVEVWVNGVQQEGKKVDRSLAYMVGSMANDPTRTNRVFTALLTIDVPDGDTTSQDEGAKKNDDKKDDGN